MNWTEFRNKLWRRVFWLKDFSHRIVTIRLWCLMLYLMNDFCLQNLTKYIIIVYLPLSPTVAFRFPTTVPILTSSFTRKLYRGLSNNADPIPAGMTDTCTTAFWGAVNPPPSVADTSRSNFRLACTKAGFVTKISPVLLSILKTSFSLPFTIL